MLSHTCQPISSFITQFGKSENIQDLKACTVPDIIRNGSRQVVASHITA